MPASEPIKATVTIRNKLGLHARPAMALVDTANRYKAGIRIRKGDQTVDGKSIMQVMMLAATQGTTLDVEVVGPDAEQLVAELRALVERRFDEE